MSMKPERFVLHAMAAALLVIGVGAQASGINGINSNNMPNRISMNVTVAKQTQGATFGDKVNAGLHAAGGALASGASMIVIECGQSACAVAFPDGSGYSADLQAMTLSPLASQQAARVREAPAADARLLGGALPGGAILSAAVSSVSNLAGSGGGAAAASYAATGRMADGGVVLASRSDNPGVIDVLDPLQDGEYQLAVVVDKATSGLKDTLKTQVRTTQPQQVRIVLGFSVEAGVLKTKHDTAKNSVGNIR